MVDLRGRCRSTLGRLDDCRWHVFGRSVRRARKRRECQCTIDGGAGEKGRDVEIFRRNEEVRGELSNSKARLAWLECKGSNHRVF